MKVMGLGCQTSWGAASELLVECTAWIFKRGIHVPALRRKHCNSCAPPSSSRARWGKTIGFDWHAMYLSLHQVQETSLAPHTLLLLPPPTRWVGAGGTAGVRGCKGAAPPANSARPTCQHEAAGCWERKCRSGQGAQGTPPLPHHSAQGIHAG